MNTGLELRCIEAGAGETPILHGVSLRVTPGETVALLGPSGCGKTTLLRVIAGLHRASSGSVLFDGEDITRVPSHRRGFGLMFQDHALFPHLDVAGNIGFGLRGAGWDTRRRSAKVQELLDAVGLAGFGRRPIAGLSGGERQRVALARTLAPGPRLLMLDEPLGSLDRSLRESLVVELRDVLARLDIPAVYVTHDQFEAFAIASRVALMRAGRLERDGPPAEIYDDPQAEFVARFLGLDNIVEGRRVEGGLVEAAGGRFAPGDPGGAAPLLLLRGEGASVVAAPGPATISGTVTARLFQGAGTRLVVRTGDNTLAFTFAAGTPLPEDGEPVHIRVERVQVLQPDRVGGPAAGA